MLVVNAFAGIILGIEIILYIVLGVNVEFRPYPPFFFIRPQVTETGSNNLIQQAPYSLGNSDLATTTTTTTTTTTPAPARVLTTCSANCGICSGITADGGAIQSSDFPSPGSYLSNSLWDCSFVMGVSAGNHIQVKFTTINAQDESNALVYTVYDAPFSEGTFLGDLNGNSINQESITSKTNKVVAGFTMDRNRPAPEFFQVAWKISYIVV